MLTKIPFSSPVSFLTLPCHSQAPKADPVREAHATWLRRFRRSTILTEVEQVIELLKPRLKVTQES
jgi:hypothetical protein